MEGEGGGAREDGVVETLVVLRPEREKLSGCQKQNLFEDPAGTRTAAGGLLAAPSAGLQTHAAPWTRQLVARRADEVDLVSNCKHPSESASKCGNRKFGTGCCEKMTSLTFSLTRVSLLVPLTFRRSPNSIPLLKCLCNNTWSH